jgi:CheY-like chemotaxis protein
MARVLALTADLLFGSRIQGDLAAAGEGVELLPSAAALSARLADASAQEAALLVVDLTDPDLDGAAVIESLAHAGRLRSIGTLGFYSHVDVEARERAERACFDQLVPRSRMAREGAALVARLLA